MPFIITVVINEYFIPREVQHLAQINPRDMFLFLQNLDLKIIAVVNRTSAMKGWTRLYKPLPNGFYQILLEGTRPVDGLESGVAIDDVVITPCVTFRE